MKKTIRIGTRGSQLALYQAEKVKNLLLSEYPDLQVELVVIKTKGDKILDVALSKIGDKGLFTKEIETALLDGAVDLAVHSLKDLPTILPDGLKLGAVPERGEFRDALVSRSGKKLAELTSGDVVATSSLRRQAALLHVNPGIVLKDIRGNVNTRLQRMEEGYCDALVMAAAGLQRLGLDRYITEIIDPEVIMPAVSQGTIAIEVRANDPEVDNLLKPLNHKETWRAVTAERAFLSRLQGGCQVPLGCYSRCEGDELVITGFVASIDGRAMLRETISGKLNNPQAAGVKLAECLLQRGAGKILEQNRGTNFS